MPTLARPPYDPELQSGLGLIPITGPLSVESLPRVRSGVQSPPIESLLEGRSVEVEDHTVRGHGGDEIIVSVFRRTGRSRSHGPGVYYIHPGGMIIGDRWLGAAALIDWVDEYGAVAATVEYRLAPEFPDPVPVEDCYAGLLWFADHCDDLGVDPERIVIFGSSAGGGLSAGTVLLARDRGGPAIAAQVLTCPMLDDRKASVSARQYEDLGPWDGPANTFGWTALLGDRVGGEDVSIYAAPARATDLTGLPPTYIDAGSSEIFRDECVAYASRIWEAGGQAELHIWPGAFHGFEMVSTAAVSIAAAQTRAAWMHRHLGPSKVPPTLILRGSEKP